MRILIVMLVAMVIPENLYAQTAMRVKAYTLHRENSASVMQLIDSTVFNYSGNRGSVTSAKEDQGFFLRHSMPGASIFCDTATSYLDTGKGVEKIALYITTYENDDSIRQTSSYSFSPNGMIMNNLLYVLDRNKNRDIVYEELYEGGQNNTWLYRNHKGYEYDSNDNIITDTSCHGSVYCSMKKYSYNNAALLEEKTLYTNTITPGIFDTVERYIYTYNIDSKIQTIYYLTYDKKNNQRDSISIDSFVYNIGGSINAIYVSRKDSKLKTWIPSHRSLYEYHSSGQPRLISHEAWDVNKQQWYTQVQNTFMYNSDGLLSGAIFPPYSRQPSTQKANIFNIYYEPVYNMGLAATQATAEYLSVFPNPARDFFYINLTGTDADGQILVRNIFGQNMRTVVYHTGQRQLKIDMSGLPPGNYFVTDAGKLSTGTMVVLQ